MNHYDIPNVDLTHITNQNRIDILAKLNDYGVAVLPNVIDGKMCDDYVSKSIKWLGEFIEPLSPAPETWITQNLPSGPRRGMMQSIIGHSPVAWELREKLYPLFCELHGTKDVITSIDGATIIPPIETSTKDWPHIDQTKSEKDIVCYQSQIVLTDTTACFRCTPKSHKKHYKIVKTLGLDRSNPWYKFTDTDITTISKWFDDWQIPIQVPKGSIILWRSTTIHSAKYVDDSSIYKPLESWDGWRCVYYICMRPKTQFTKRNKTTIQKALKEGRTTNHWGTKLFPKTQRWDNTKHPSVLKLLENPSIIVQKDYTPIQKKITFTE